MTFPELILLFALLTAVITVVALLLNRKPLSNIESDRDVLGLAASGDRLKAIKAYRQLHGASLKDARRFVDTHLAQLATETRRGTAHGK